MKLLSPRNVMQQVAAALPADSRYAPAWIAEIMREIATAVPPRTGAHQ